MVTERATYRALQAFEKTAPACFAATLAGAATNYRRNAGSS
jgi:hypothetical protein